MTAASDSEPAQSSASGRRSHQNVGKRMAREGIARPSGHGCTRQLVDQLAAGCDISIMWLSG